MNYYMDVWRKYAIFKGRATRKEHWYFMFFHTVFCSLFMLIDFSLLGIPMMTYVYYAASVLPSLAVTVRRIQDGGRSGLWLLLGYYLPILGGLVILVFLIWPSSKDSEHGPDPYPKRWM